MTSETKFAMRPSFSLVKFLMNVFFHETTILNTDSAFFFVSLKSVRLLLVLQLKNSDRKKWLSLLLLLSCNDTAMLFTSRVSAGWPSRGGDVTVYSVWRGGDVTVYSVSRGGDVTVYSVSRGGDVTVYSVSRGGDVIVYSVSRGGDVTVYSVT